MLCQTLEVATLKFFPAILRLHLALPAVGELREKRYRSAVFDGIG
jgi:hypothetical protein